MTSFDAEYLFTNIPLEKTVKICCDSLYKNQELLSNINKNQFEKLHFAATIFFFDCIVYEQVDEEIWINNCLDKFNPVYDKKYVDDTFVLFRSAHHCDKFKEYLNEKQANIN